MEFDKFWAGHQASQGRGFIGKDEDTIVDPNPGHYEAYAESSEDEKKDKEGEGNYVYYIMDGFKPVVVSFCRLDPYPRPLP